MKSSIHIWITISFLLLCAPKICFAQTDPPAGHWTETHWVEWWNFIQSEHVAGYNDEDIYWRIRSTAEHFGTVVPELDVDLPPAPDFGGGGGGPPGGGYIKVFGEKGSASKGKLDSSGTRAMICIGYPDGINPCDYHSGSPPPQWVVAGMALLGANLASSSHPYAKLTGAVLINVAGIFEIWILLEEDGEEDDE